MGHVLKFLLMLLFFATEPEEEARRREEKEAAKAGNSGLRTVGDFLGGTLGTILMGLFLYGIMTHGIKGFAIGLLVFEALLFAALAFLILTFLFRPELGFGARLGMYLVLAVLAIIQFSNFREKPKAAPATRTVATVPAAEEKPFERAEWIIREELVAKVDLARANARTRWRADVVAAGATGAAGVVPPMLEVTPKAPGIWQLKNLSRATVCVRIARVSQPDYGKGRWLHCALDAVNDCSELLAGSARRLTLEVNNRVAGCASTLLEYRVGTFTQPEPSWWSTTALEELEDSSASPDRAHLKWPLEQLRAEITRLEKLLGEPERAARWREELRRYDSRVESD